MDWIPVEARGHLTGLRISHKTIELTYGPTREKKINTVLETRDQFRPSLSEETCLPPGGGTY